MRSCTSCGQMIDDGARTCINCGEKETKVTEAGHDWGKWKTEDGKKIRTCSVCGAVETQEISSEPHYHTWATKEVEVTCTENGGTLWYCTTCGESSLTNTIWAAGHSWSDWETTKEPTTSSVGYEQRTCSTCGEVDVAAIPALDPKTGEKFEDSIDLSIKIDSDEKVTEYWYNSPNVQPSDGRVKDVLISDWREWESAAISIVVNENDTLTIVFYTKQGERVEITTEPPLEDFMYCVKIWEDGTYDCYYLGDFS